MPDFKIDVGAVESAAARGHALDFPHTRLSDAIDRFVMEYLRERFGQA